MASLTHSPAVEAEEEVPSTNVELMRLRQRVQVLELENRRLREQLEGLRGRSEPLDGAKGVATGSSSCNEMDEWGRGESQGKRHVANETRNEGQEEERRKECVNELEGVYGKIEPPGDGIVTQEEGAGGQVSLVEGGGERGGMVGVVGGEMRDQGGGWEERKRRKCTTTTTKKKKKRSKELDPSAYHFPLVALRLFYLGDRYHGFASQGIGLPTVEAELFSAMHRCRLLSTTPENIRPAAAAVGTDKSSDQLQTNESSGHLQSSDGLLASIPVSGADERGSQSQAMQFAADPFYSRCGRTDRGVSAAGQVVALRVRGKRRKRAAERGKGAAVATAAAAAGGGGGGGEDVVEVKKAAQEVESDEEREVGGEEGKRGEIKYDAGSGGERRLCKQDHEGDDDDLIDLNYLVTAINSSLPHDIRVTSAAVAPQHFHARFHCDSREYRFFFVPDANFHLEAMSAAASLFVGLHDFRAFCKPDGSKQQNFKRHIFSCGIQQVHSLSCSVFPRGVWAIVVVGSSFLWHQIRCMASLLFQIAKGIHSPTVVLQMLNVDSSEPHHVSDDAELMNDEFNITMAPAMPLVLHRCSFSSLNIMAISSDAKEKIVRHFLEQLKETLIRAAQLTTCIESI